VIYFTRQAVCGESDGEIFRATWHADSAPPVVGPFLRGECNDDGDVDIADARCLLDWLFVGGGEPPCLAATDANGDGALDLSDAVYLLGHLFLGGPIPVAPFPDCGPGSLPTDAELGCVVPPSPCS
jgi:hypothetical protein